MNYIIINSLTKFKVEQIKITGSIKVGGKAIPATLNKTLDSAIISQLPPELVSVLTAYAFGGDFTSAECKALADELNKLAVEKEVIEAEQEATRQAQIEDNEELGGENV